MKTIHGAGLAIRPLRSGDIPEVVRIQNESWHEYYRQYQLYSIIKNSVNEHVLTEDWEKFLSEGAVDHSSLIVGTERRAYVALVEGSIVGVAAVSSYVEGKWPPVDEILRDPKGKVAKTAKFQELYIKPEMRRCGAGRYLSVARADYMLAKGYSAIFLTTYADAYLTSEYHLKNGLKLVYEYMSLQTFEEGKRVKISCFLDTDLSGYRDRLQKSLELSRRQQKVPPLLEMIL